MHRTGSESTTRTRSMNSKDKEYFYLILLLVPISLIFYTDIHDPILHGLAIWFNGWDFGGYQSGFLSGSTDAIIKVSEISGIPTSSLYIFYMFPAISMFILAFILIIFFKFNRLALVSGNVIMLLNFASFYPGITGSDANKAMEVLIAHGWGEFTASLFQWVIFYLAIVLYASYQYIITENNPKDAQRRMENINPLN